MSLDNAAQQFIKGRHDSIQQEGETAGAAALFVGVAGLSSFWLYTSHYPRKVFQVSMSVRTSQPARPIVKQVIRLLGCKKADKKFSEATGRVSYLMTNEYYEVTLSSGPPTACEVEQYETEEIIPAVKEHTKTVTKFRLVDPKCLEGGQAPPPKTEEEREVEVEADFEAAEKEKGISQGDVEAVEAAVLADAENTSPEELEAASDVLDKVRMATITGEEGEAVNTSTPSEPKA